MGILNIFKNKNDKKSAIIDYKSQILNEFDVDIINFDTSKLKPIYSDSSEEIKGYKTVFKKYIIPNIDNIYYKGLFKELEIEEIHSYDGAVMKKYIFSNSNFVLDNKSIVTLMDFVNILYDLYQVDDDGNDSIDINELAESQYLTPISFGIMKESSRNTCSISFNENKLTFWISGVLFN